MCCVREGREGDYREKRQDTYRISNRRKKEDQIELPVQMTVKGGFRGTETYWYSVAAFTTGQGWPRPHFPSDRLRSQDR